MISIGFLVVCSVKVIQCLPFNEKREEVMSILPCNMLILCCFILPFYIFIVLHENKSFILFIFLILFISITC